MDRRSSLTSWKLFANYQQTKAKKKNSIQVSSEQSYPLVMKQHCCTEPRILGCVWFTDKNRTPLEIHWKVPMACLCHREMLTSEEFISSFSCHTHKLSCKSRQFFSLFSLLLIIRITGLHILTWATLLFRVVVRHSFKLLLTAPSSSSAPNASQLKKQPAWPMRCVMTARK